MDVESIAAELTTLEDDRARRYVTRAMQHALGVWTPPYEPPNGRPEWAKVFENLPHIHRAFRLEGGRLELCVELSEEARDTLAEALAEYIRTMPRVLGNFAMDQIIQRLEERRRTSSPSPWQRERDDELNDEGLGNYRGLRVRGRSQSRLDNRSRQ